jgi:hypothetical protein
LGWSTELQGFSLGAVTATLLAVVGITAGPGFVKGLQQLGASLFLIDMAPLKETA